MNPHLHATLKWLPNLAGALSFVLTVFCGLVAYDTIWNAGATRIIMGPGSARGYLTPGGTMNIEYTRGFEVVIGGDAELHRRVVCTCSKTGQVEEYDFPVARREFSPGKYPPVLRVLDSPMHITAGSPCRLYVVGAWRPRFAVSAKATPLDVLEFTVKGSRDEK